MYVSSNMCHHNFSDITNILIKHKDKIYNFKGL